MIDDMYGLYPTAQRAYEAGTTNGQNAAFKTVMSVLSAISHKYEVEGNTKGFHAVEDCCRTIRQYAATPQSEQES